MSSNVYGIDLGGYNLKELCKYNGRILNEKNIVAVMDENQLYAYGDDAFAMYEKAPDNIKVSFPVKGGVISEYAYEQTMLAEFLDARTRGRIKGAEFVVAVPANITEVERKSFFDLLYKCRARAKSVLVCDKSIATAVGLGIDVNRPEGNLVIDIGADTTEMAVISLGGMVVSELKHFGGNRLDDSIIGFIRREYSLLIGKKTACFLKETLGNAYPGAKESVTIVGQDVVNGLPIEMEIKAATVYEAIKQDLDEMCQTLKMLLERINPELARDIVNSGIYLTGGASRIKELDKLFSEVSGIKVNLSENPEESAARGLIKIVSDNKYSRIPYTMKKKFF